MLKINEKMIQILEDVVFFKRQKKDIPDLDLSYLKIESIHIMNRYKKEDLDIIERQIITYSDIITSGDMLRPEFYNALHSALLLLEDTKKANPTFGRTFYKIDFLDDKGKTSEIINAIYHMLHFKQIINKEKWIICDNEELIDNLFIPNSKDNKYVRTVIMSL